MIQAPGADDDDAAPATDNAISALGKLCRHRAGKVDAAQLLPF